MARQRIRAYKKRHFADAGVFCEFSGALYYLDGNEIWEIAPDYSVTAAEAYIPVVMINALPDISGGEDNEAYNLIGAGFCVKYNGDNVSMQYRLPQKALDGTAVRVSVNAQDLAEGVHFTVNRQEGTVDFSCGVNPHGAPAAGTNNVWITAFKTVSGSRQKIAGCRVALPFGGEAAGVFGGTRVFVTGNAQYPRAYWRSDLGNEAGGGMRYFPDTCEEYLNQTTRPITAAAKMGESCNFKQKSISRLRMCLTARTFFYPVRECTAPLAAICPAALRLLTTLWCLRIREAACICSRLPKQIGNAVKPLSANKTAAFGREHLCARVLGRL